MNQKSSQRNSQKSRLLKSIFTEGVNFRKMQKGDFIALEYSQKAYLGKPHGLPDLKAAMVQIDGTSYFRFKNPKDEKYYDEKVQDLLNLIFFKFL